MREALSDLYSDEGSYFPMNGNNTADNTMNITSQPIGNNYNQSIGSQYKNSTMGGTTGMNIPQTPTGFGQALQNAENPTVPQTQKTQTILSGDQAKKFNQLRQNAMRNGGTYSQEDWNSMKDLINPIDPVSNSQWVQLEGGDNSVPQQSQTRMRDHFGDSPYLTEDYKYDNWNKRAINEGIEDEISRRVLYEDRIKPLINEAREEELRQAFFALKDPNTSEQDKMNAMALIEYHRKDPFLEESAMEKLGLMPNPDYNGESSSSNNVLSALKNYEEGEQWMSPDGTGTSRTQCSNWVSDVLRRAGIKGLGSANGDELMKQFGGAYHEGLDGIQAGDVLNFKDHVGIYAGNGQYVARNSSGGVHQGSMEEAIREFGQPLGYGSIKEYTGKNNTSKRYIKNPNPQWKQKEDYKHALALDRLSKQQAGQQKLALLRSQLKGDGTKTKNGNGKNSKNSSDLHNSLSAVAELESGYKEDLDANALKEYKTNHAKALDGVKNAIKNEYPDLKQGLDALKGKGYSTEDIGVILASEIYKQNNTQISFDALADAVSDIITSSEYGDTSYDSKALSPKIKKRLYSELNTFKNMRNRRNRDVNLNDTIYGGYYNTSDAGLTDVDIEDRNRAKNESEYKKNLFKAKLAEAKEKGIQEFGAENKEWKDRIEAANKKVLEKYNR